MVKTYELKLTNLQQRILRLLFVKTGLKLNALAIAKSLGFSQPAVSKALPFLEKRKLIKIEKNKESKRFSIELNRDNDFVIKLKRADNLKLIYESQIVNFLEEKFPGSVIILFGSYSYGEDTIQSDIDIAIIGCKEKQVNLEKFEKFFFIVIRINFYESFAKIHKHLRSNIFNGIVLVGRINL